VEGRGAGLGAGSGWGNGNTMAVVKSQGTVISAGGIRMLVEGADVKELRTNCCGIAQCSSMFDGGAGG